MCGSAFLLFLAGLLLPLAWHRVCVTYETLDPQSGNRLVAFVQPKSFLLPIGTLDLLVRVEEDGREVCRARVIRSIDAWPDRLLPENQVVALRVDQAATTLFVKFASGKEEAICLGFGHF